MSLPTERQLFQFPGVGTVIYTCDHSSATGRPMSKLYVQVIDDYRYHRELTVEFRYEPGDSKNLRWEFHIYRHPGVRRIETITQGVAERFIERFLDLSANYPILLFNGRSEDRATCEGFVHLADRLHAGYDFSVKLLD